METGFTLIAELGLPVAGGLVMAYFIFLVMKQLMDGLVSEIQTVQAISRLGSGIVINQVITLYKSTIYTPTNMRGNIRHASIVLAR